jgi:hypothetical protein
MGSRWTCFSEVQTRRYSLAHVENSLSAMTVILAAGSSGAGGTPCVVSRAHRLHRGHELDMRFEWQAGHIGDSASDIVCIDTRRRVDLATGLQTTFHADPRLVGIEVICADSADPIVSEPSWLAYTTNHGHTYEPDILPVHPKGTGLHPARIGHFLRDPAFSGGGIPIADLARWPARRRAKNPATTADHSSSWPDGGQDRCPVAEGLLYRERPCSPAAPRVGPALHGPAEIRSRPNRTWLAGQRGRYVGPVAVDGTAR